MSRFVQTRAGLLQHLEHGRMSLKEFAVFNLLLLLADKATGIWWGGAPAVSAKFGSGDLDLRAARTALHNLEQAGYIKRFMVQGQRGNHPIGVNKYQVSFGVLRGKYLNTDKSASYKELCYEARSEDVSEAVSVPVSEAVCEDVTLSIPLYPYTPKPESKNERETASADEPTGNPNPATPIIEKSKALASTLFKLMGTPQELNQPTTVKKWYQQAKQALESFSDNDALTTALNWVFSGDSKAEFWHRCIVEADWPMAMVARKADKIVAAALAAQRKQKIASKPKPTATKEPRPAVESKFLTAEKAERI